MSKSNVSGAIRSAGGGGGSLYAGWMVASKNPDSLASASTPHIDLLAFYEKHSLTREKRLLVIKIGTVSQTQLVNSYVRQTQLVYWFFFLFW